MTDEAQAKNEFVNGKASLVEYMEAGCKPKESWRIGTEHEKFAYHLADLSPLDYEGPTGVRAFLDGLTRY